MKRPVVASGLILMMVLSFLLLDINKPEPFPVDENSEFILYRDSSGLFVYNPIQKKHTQILEGFKLFSVSISDNNRLAFTAVSSPERSNVFIVDFPYTENTPINITSDLSGNRASLFGPSQISPDGQYVVFHYYGSGNDNLMVWTENRIYSVFESENSVNETAWSKDNTLTFTEYGPINQESEIDTDDSEIFIWDGNTTHNFSQNPSGVDRFSTSSEDGQLAFLSERNGEYGIYVWDGQSGNNGVPDVNSFINIAPDHTSWFSIPSWTEDNTIVFKDTANMSYVEWDPSGNITPVPERVYDQYSHASGDSGKVVYCVLELSGWGTYLWDQGRIFRITTSRYAVYVLWNNGNGIICSDG